MKKKLFMMLCFILTVFAAIGITETKAKSRETVWNTGRTIEKTEGAFTYHAYYSKDKKKAWIYQIDINPDKKHTTLSIPKKIDGRKVTCLGHEWNTSYGDTMIGIFGTYAEPYHLADASTELINEIKELRLPDTVETIEQLSFSGMDSIRSVTIPKNTVTIKRYAFYGCDNLETVKLPDKLKFLDTNAFSDCPKLKKMTLSSKNKKYKLKNKCIITRKDNALVYSYASGKVCNIPNNVKTIKKYALNNCSANTVNIPASVTKIEGYAFHQEYYQDGKIKNVTVSSDNPVYAKDGQCIYNKIDKTLAIAVVDEKGVLYISDKIEKLVKDKNIININTYDESMTKVVFPDTLKTVGAGGFSGMSDADKVYFTAAAPPEVVFLQNEYADLPIFTRIYVPKGSLKIYKDWYKKNNYYSYVYEWHTF